MQLTRALGAFCLLTMAAVAQEFRANLQGIITDPSLAAVPSAAVILKNVETGIESVTVSDPLVSPRSCSERPGPCPGCIGALPCIFGSAKLLLPSPP